MNEEQVKHAVRDYIDSLYAAYCQCLNKNKLGKNLSQVYVLLGEKYHQKSFKSFSKSEIAQRFSIFESDINSLADALNSSQYGGRYMFVAFSKNKIGCYEKPRLKLFKKEDKNLIVDYLNFIEVDFERYISENERQDLLQFLRRKEESQRIQIEAIIVNGALWFIVHRYQCSRDAMPVGNWRYTLNFERKLNREIKDRFHFLSKFMDYDPELVGSEALKALNEAELKSNQEVLAKLHREQMLLSGYVDPEKGGVQYNSYDQKELDLIRGEDKLPTVH